MKTVHGCSTGQPEDDGVKLHFFLLSGQLQADNLHMGMCVFMHVCVSLFWVCGCVWVCDVMTPIRVIPSWPISVKLEVSGSGGQYMTEGWGRLSTKLDSKI